jgi:putative FmdB family regulatory protein
MPIYEYRCERGHTFEVLQSISDDPLATCQSCDAPVKRVFHPVAVHFKGSGFYSTDYGKRSRGADAAETDGGEKKKDDKKPAEKPKSAAGDSGSGGGSSSSD